MPVGAAAWEDAAEALLDRVYGPDWERLTAMAAGIEVPEDASLDYDGRAVMPHGTVL